MRLMLRPHRRHFSFLISLLYLLPAPGTELPPTEAVVERFTAERAEDWGVCFYLLCHPLTLRQVRIQPLRWDRRPQPGEYQLDGDDQHGDQGDAAGDKQPVAFFLSAFVHGVPPTYSSSLHLAGFWSM